MESNRKTPYIDNASKLVMFFWETIQFLSTVTKQSRKEIQSQLHNTHLFLNIMMCFPSSRKGKKEIFSMLKD